MKRVIFVAILVAVVVAILLKIGGDRRTAEPAENEPVWLEADSSTAIGRRIASDFNITRDELREELSSRHGTITDADIDTFIARKYVERSFIDGKEMFHRKSVRNVGLLNPDYSGPRVARGAAAKPARIAYVDSIVSAVKGTNDLGLSHKVSYRFTVRVPGNEALVGDTLRVWMPLPLTGDLCSRQTGLVIDSVSQADYVLSDGRSLHNSIYMSAPAAAPGDTAVFSYSATFVTSGAWTPEQTILDNIKPYNKDSELYARYTAFDSPHIVRLDSLAHAIVGSETNPFKQSELVYDYIINRYPWAGAREYSTIECIPEYVLDRGYGDCGQVTLLYISLMRTLGVPARWESGWMLHPGEVNLHDWGEVYFEGLGWLPVDVSFGRYTGSDNKDITTFYSHGIDSYRMAVNKTVGGAFYPAKRYVRSETVDFQLGEVECSKGNMFYPAWECDMDVLSCEPVKK